MRSLIWALLLSALSPLAIAQRDLPAFDYQTVMETYFDDSSGLIAFRDYIVAFAPDEPFRGEVVVLDAAGEIVSRHAFSENYQSEAGVFAKVRAQGPADVQLSEPGIYQLIFLVDGQPVARLPVVLKQISAGDDPYNPQAKFAFDGYWRTHAFLTERSYNGDAVPELNLWLGGMDLMPDQRRGAFVATLYRDGDVVAHSQVRQGSISSGHFELKKTFLYRPHSVKESPNALPFTMDDLESDGSYELRVTRPEDGKMLRSYDFTVSDAKIQGIAQSALGTEPAVNFVLPRVLQSGTTTFEMVPCTWIRDGG